MISIKKIISTTAIAVLSVSLFAQMKSMSDFLPSSKTSEATQEIFDTDVDKFMSVTSWSEVKPEKFFGYFGIGNTPMFRYTSYDLGFAKQFSKCYWGTYFSGKLGTVNTEKDESAETETTTNGQTEFIFSNLFGLGNGVGLGVDFYYADNGSKKEVRGNSKTDTDKRIWGLAVSAGLNEYTFKKFNLAPYATVTYIMNTNRGSKVVTDTAVTSTTVDSRQWTLGIEAGADVDLSKSEAVEQTLSLGAGFGFTKPVDNDVKDTNNTKLALPVSYKVVYHATEKLGLGVLLKADTSMNFGKGGEDIKSFNFDFTPSVSTGVTFDTQKKVILNAGLGFAIPAFTYEKNTINSKSNSEANWDGNDASLDFKSGFNFVPTKNISVDCSWQILSHLFGTDTKSDLNENTDFWYTVNKVLVHNITFAVSVKF